MSVRILLVDDQPLLLQGFAMILSVEEDLEVVGQASDGARAVEAVETLRPDVVLMDVQMPVLDGIEATRRIVAAHPDVKVVILTTFDRDDYLFDALEAGASGFLLKNADPDELVGGVRDVAEGHALLAPEVTRRVISRMTAPGARRQEGHHDHTPPGAQRTTGPHAGTTGQRGGPFQQDHEHGQDAGGHPRGGAHAVPPSPPLPDLTQREREMLQMIARGMSNGEIAAEAFVTEATVKTHVSNILAKLGVRDRVQAVIAAYEAGLVSPGS